MTCVRPCFQVTLWAAPIFHFELEDTPRVGASVLSGSMTLLDGWVARPDRQDPESPEMKKQSKVVGLGDNDGVG